MTNQPRAPPVGHKTTCQLQPQERPENGLEREAKQGRKILPNRPELQKGKINFWKCLKTKKVAHTQANIGGSHRAAIDSGTTYSIEWSG
jgi:hypothetical protein